MKPTNSFQRTISLNTAIGLVVSTVIGSGIFIRPAEMAALLGSPALIFSVWIAAGLITMLSAMVLAEVAAMLPEDGGNYAFMRHMYGDFVAYIYGWAAFAVINCAGTAGISFITAQYFEYFVKLPRFSPEIEQSFIIHIPMVGDLYPLKDFGVKILTILILIVFSIVSYRSTKGSSRLQNVFFYAKTLAIIFLVFGLFFSGAGSFSNFLHSDPSITTTGFALVAAFVAASNGALQAFDGSSNMLYVTGEIRDPGRSIPKSLFIGLSICIVVYLLVNAAMLYILPVTDMAASSLVASDAAQKAFGVMGGGIIAALICFSVLGTTNSCVFTSPRMTFAMARKNVFFENAGKIHPKFNTPGNAIIIHLVVMILMVLTGSFFMLADMYIFIVWVFNLLMMVGLFVLRKKMKNAERPYKVWGYPWMPVVVILFNAMYVVITLINDIQNYREGKTQVMNSVLGIVIVALGIPLYWYFSRKKKNEGINY